MRALTVCQPHAHRLAIAAQKAREAIDLVVREWRDQSEAHADAVVGKLERVGFQKILEKLSQVQPAAALTTARPSPHARGVAPGPAPADRPRPARVVSPPAASNGDGTVMKGMHRAMLTALAQHPDGLTKKKILIHTGYASSGPVSTAFADLSREGWATTEGSTLRITPAGISALGEFEPLPVGDDLRFWLLTSEKLSGMEKALLKVICEAHPHAIRKGDVLQQTGYASSGPVSTAFGKLVGLGYVVSQGPSVLKAADELFG